MKVKTGAKWIGTVVCLVVMAALVLFGEHCALIWLSVDLRHSIEVYRGGVGIGWRPVGWSPQKELRIPGWRIGPISSPQGLVWWFARHRNWAWESFCVPLWIPLFLACLPTGVFWYQQRRSTAKAIGRFVRSWTPDQPQRMTIRLVGAMCVVHLIVAFVVCSCVVEAYSFFWGATGYSYFELVLMVVRWALVWGTPFWGVLWALLYVRFRNRLLQNWPELICLRCGYNLTGNVSGVCPECGMSVGRASPAQ